MQRIRTTCKADKNDTETGSVHQLSGCIFEGDSYDKCAVQSATPVALPSLPEVPIARISGPSVLSVCDGPELIGLLSSGGGIYPLRYQWEVRPAYEPGAGTATEAARPKLHEGSNPGKVVDFPEED